MYVIRSDESEPGAVNLTMPLIVDCGTSNWTVVKHFIESYNPQYFNHRPWIIGGLFTLAVTGLLSNLIVVAFLLHKPTTARSAFTLLVMQLALADGMVSLFCMLADAVWNVTMEWTGGRDLCRFVKFMQMFSLYASTMILTGITVERCITVTYPFTMSRPQFALQRAKAISAVVWTLAGVCSIPQALIFHVEQAPICTDFMQCVTFGTYTEPWQEVAYTMSTLCVMFLVPLIIIIACLVTIYAKISEEAKLASGKRHTEELLPCDMGIVKSTPYLGYGRKMYRRTRQLSLWMTLVIAIVFVFCWAPYYISMVAYLFQFEIPSGWMTLILSIGMTSTVLNPVVYCVFKVIQNNTKASSELAERGSASCSGGHGIPLCGRSSSRKCSVNTEAGSRRHSFLHVPGMPGSRTSSWEALNNG